MEIVPQFEDHPNHKLEPYLVFHPNSIYIVGTLKVLSRMTFDTSLGCPVFIGRQDDLQSLDRLITRSNEGNGGIALISGEAGIGKSRLVREAKVRAPKRTTILEGYWFQTEMALPYAPILDLFRNIFQYILRETSLPSQRGMFHWNSLLEGTD